MYNRKIIKTKGYTEIWDYKFPVPTKGELVEENDSKKEVIKRRSFEELSQEEQSERLKNMQKKRREAKWRLQRIIDSNFDNHTSFLTLTTKRNIQDRDEFTALFKSFVKRFNYSVYHTKKRKLAYCGTLERQKRGAFHMHLILFNIPFVPHNQLLELWGLGAIRINHLENLDDVSNAGRYVSKYLSKGIGENLLESFGKNSYLRSRNLKMPVEEKFTDFKPLVIESEMVLDEQEYTSKVYVNHEFIDNPVHYRKIKNREEN
ncbi:MULTISPECIES: Rep protein [Liquorilactobacillus]|uniref:rolling circle replication-associated protein n=1 Tax=Liquorilactobacillus TaxID=2767888 RepID=UPI001E4AB989|nr:MULTISPECIES: Rep protein [Liquorilactobacillus]MCC7667184.1 Rep protein [Liquorilactobacillus satsumensis]MCP9314998.1 Rep protein [Liquorilactobacillus nagelii]